MTTFDGPKFVYTPSDGFLGIDGFSYQARNTGLTSPHNQPRRTFPAVEVQIHVVEPEIVKPANDAFSLEEDQPITLSPAQLTGNDSNADFVSCVGQSLLGCRPATLRTGFGTLALAWEALGTEGSRLSSAVYTPDPDANGTDSFTYLDGYFGGDALPHTQVDYEGTVVLHVEPGADPPTA